MKALTLQSQIDDMLGRSAKELNHLSREAVELLNAVSAAHPRHLGDITRLRLEREQLLAVLSRISRTRQHARSTKR